MVLSPTLVVPAGRATERLVEMMEEGKPPDVAQLLVSLGTATREGFMTTHTDVVERLTGLKPHSLATVLGD